MKTKNFDDVSYINKYNRLQFVINEENMPNFNFTSFTNEEDKDCFISCLAKYSQAYLTSALEIDSKQYDFDENLNESIYYPLWNNRDNELMYEIIYDENFPQRWNQYASYLSNKYNQGFEEIRESLNNYTSTIRDNDINQIIYSFRNLLYRLQREILTSDFPNNLRALFLPNYIVLFSKIVYYTISKRNEIVKREINYKQLLNFLNNNYSAINRNYDNIFLAFQFYLSQITVKRLISRNAFLYYHANKELNKKDNNYFSQICSNSDEAIRVLEKKRNITLTPHIKNQLRKYAIALSHDGSIIVNQNDVFLWEFLYDCVQEQSTKNKIPTKIKNTILTPLEEVIEDINTPKDKAHWKRGPKATLIKSDLNDYFDKIKNHSEYVEINENVEYALIYYVCCVRKYLYPDLQDYQSIDKIAKKVCEKLSSFLLSYSFDIFFNLCDSLYDDIMSFLVL